MNKVIFIICVINSLMLVGSSNEQVQADLVKTRAYLAQGTPNQAVAQRDLQNAQRMADQARNQSMFSKR